MAMIETIYQHTGASAKAQRKIAKAERRAQEHTKRDATQERAARIAALVAGSRS